MNTLFFASAIVLITGIFWGISWLPVRAIADLGLDGAWGTGAITLFLLPFMMAQATQLRNANLIGLASVALGGAAFAPIPSAFSTARWRLSSYCGSSARSGAC